MGFAIVCFVIAAVCGLISLVIIGSLKKDEKKDADELKRSLESGEWRFPFVTFGVECDKAGIHPPLDKTGLANAKEIILQILRENNIPGQYHARFCTEEMIETYFEDYADDERLYVEERLITRVEEHGLRSIDTPAAYEKGKIILENVLDEEGVASWRLKNYRSEKEIKNLLQQAIDAVEEEQEREKQEKLAQLRSEEAELEKKYQLPLSFVGRAKTVAYCKEMVAYYEWRVQDLEEQLQSKISGAAKRSMDYDQVKNNWAVHGGIASAIAGPAAGVMIAADAKQRIDKRNARNAQLQSINMQLLMLEAKEIKGWQAEAQKDIETWQKKLHAAEYALEEWQDPQRLLDEIQPEVVSYEVTPTGAVKLSISFRKTPDLKVFGEKPGFVDGSIVVRLKDGDTVCGNAICCLPFEGTAYSINANCICTQTTDPDKTYQFEFAPNKLWVMENL